jgi:nicotinamide mononucleotide transporter
MEQLNHLLTGLGATDILEQVAVLCALLYILLISFKSQWGWLFATISSGVYIFICYFGKLYLETGLQVFYVAMAVYGWYEWSDNEYEAEEGIVQWKFKTHLYLVFGGLLVALITGITFKLYTDQANPFMDAFTTVFSLIATYMVTKKVLENWLYWIVIDIVAAILHVNRGLELTGVLYIVYTVLSVFGYYYWNKSFSRK